MVYLSLGSNLGNREDYLSKARYLIDQRAGRTVGISSIYETEPWTNSSISTEPDASYLNQVVSIETKFSPEKLLSELLVIEKELGRIRTGSEKGYIPRTIDIDILFYDNLIIGHKYQDTDIRTNITQSKDQDALRTNLMIPHPLLHERKFVLIPLEEIAPKFIHPVLKKTIRELITECSDSSDVKKIVS